MSEMNYERYQLESEHIDVLSRVRKLVFLRTNFEERWNLSMTAVVHRNYWPKRPRTLRQIVLYPVALIWCLLAQAFYSFLFSEGRKMVVKSYAKELKAAAWEWKKSEKWLQSPEVRATILKADVPDGEGEDPFFVAEKISRFLLTDREIREDFKFESYTNRIAMSALVLADIGFADYREFEDPQKRRKRSRREY